MTFVCAGALACVSAAQHTTHPPGEQRREAQPARQAPAAPRTTAAPGPSHDTAHGRADGRATKGAGAFLMQQESGTSRGPSSAPAHMFFTRAGSWNLMGHAQAFIADLQQTGPRGGDKFFSANWFMGMAERQAGRGSVMFRAMLSLEPATVTHRRYPLLFQTGETAFGSAIVDGQHPHDLFMELSVQYARPVSENTYLNIYAAPIGDPALGPTAFPHRISAAELPQAPLGHHLQDSTHIASEVVTVGLRHRRIGIEASGFHGREPDEHRWNIDTGPIDSWAARLSLFPTANLSAQASVGRLEEPEELETTDIIRATASLTYNRPLGAGNWASSLIWGRNHKTENGQNLNSYLAESVVNFARRNYLTGRVEWLDRDELFPHHNGGGHGDEEPAVGLEGLEGRVFRVAAYTMGYTRDFNLIPGWQTGLGANFTFYTIPRALNSVYGERPVGFLVYLRIRPGAAGPHGAHGQAP